MSVFGSFSFLTLFLTFFCLQSHSKHSSLYRLFNFTQYSRWFYWTMALHRSMKRDANGTTSAAKSIIQTINSVYDTCCLSCHLAIHFLKSSLLSCTMRLSRIAADSVYRLVGSQVVTVEVCRPAAADSDTQQIRYTFSIDRSHPRFQLSIPSLWNLQVQLTVAVLSVDSESVKYWP